MDKTIDDMLNIGESIELFSYRDLYSASIHLFKSLNYPVVAVKETANVSVLNFIYNIAEKNIFFSKLEMEYLHNTQNISYLFKIDKYSNGLRKANRKTTKHHMDSIVFLAVELEGNLDERSSNAYYLTYILSKCFSSPVVVLFRYCNVILFAGQTNINEEVSEPSIVLSDWFSTDKNDIALIERLMDIIFDYQKQYNFYNIYYDLLWSISRGYFTYQESEEFIKYGLMIDEYINPGYQGFEYYPVYFNGEKAMEQIHKKRTYYQDLYGSDYISRDEQSKINLIEENESSLSELYDSLIMDEIIDDQINQENGLELSNEDTEDFDLDELDNDVDEDFSNIDESYFEDPLKLLGFLDEQQKN